MFLFVSIFDVREKKKQKDRQHISTKFRLTFHKKMIWFRNLPIYTLGQIDNEK